LRSYTKDDSFVVSISNFGEGCGEREMMFMAEALNVDPLTLFAVMEKLSGEYDFQVPTASKCRVIVDATEVLVNKERELSLKGLSLADWQPDQSVVERALEEFAQVVKYFLEGNEEAARKIMFNLKYV
jgi:DNA-binding GntR family transcriptional regulator